MKTERGRILGYIRVSSLEQNTARQLDGVQLDLTFEEKASGKDTNRPKLQELLRTAYKGDIVKVHSIDRIARNLQDLESIIRQIIQQGAEVHFIKENLIFNGKEDGYSTLMLQMLGAVSQFERTMIRTRQQEGIEIRKAAGGYKGIGRKREVTDEQIAEIKRRAAAGDKKTVIAADLKISRESVYKYLK